MATICRVLEQDAPPVKSTPPAQGRVLERTAPTRLVRISGHDLGEELLLDKVVDLTVQETARGLSSATVVVSNEGLHFTDHELLQGKNLDVEIFTGYQNTRSVRRGFFTAAVPKYAFRNQAMPLVTLQCFGEEWPLSISEERLVYENLRDSEIATKIAQRNGLKADVDQTSPVLEHVAQFNMTDIEFLENRALMYGYDVYVEGGTLHFHKPRFKHSGLVLMFGGGERGVLTSFEVCVDPWVTGSAWTKSGIDRVTGKEWEFRSTDASDPVAQEIRRRGGPGFQRASTLATVAGRQPRRYIVGDGHEQTEGEARGQVQGYAQAAEWVVVGSADVMGIEVLKARQVVTILGVGHLSGDYYVADVAHRITPRGYRMQFRVMRPGVGRLEDRFKGIDPGSEGRRDVTADSPSAGEAEIQP